MYILQIVSQVDRTATFDVHVPYGGLVLLAGQVRHRNGRTEMRVFRPDGTWGEWEPRGSHEIPRYFGLEVLDTVAVQ